MASFSPNALCPCGSGQKYKKCCARYHKGVAAPDALALMKSRYSAYAAGKSRYIIATTHPDNRDYTTDMKRWRKEIDDFCRHTRFETLEIIRHWSDETYAYVHFRAYLSGGTLEEKSRFIFEKGRWYYLDGTFETTEG